MAQSSAACAAAECPDGDNTPAPGCHWCSPGCVCHCPPAGGCPKPGAAGGATMAGGLPVGGCRRALDGEGTGLGPSAKRLLPTGVDGYDRLEGTLLASSAGGRLARARSPGVSLPTPSESSSLSSPGLGRGSHSPTSLASDMPSSTSLNHVPHPRLTPFSPPADAQKRDHMVPSRFVYTRWYFVPRCRMYVTMSKGRTMTGTIR
mmetsp:Transcript_44828/g.109378  ORF Transcript_44828/g.109378 Transcript_44828/m.109378 type:complete len:204 (-) Transcript_44828:366-977(-)